VYACVFLQQQQQAQQQQQQLQGGSGSAGQPPERLVAASGESLFLWDVSTQALLQTVPSPPVPEAAAAVPERWRPGYLFGVAAQPDGPLLGAACSDGRLRLWAREGGDSAITPLCTLPWNQAMGADCCFAPGGLFCACSKDGSLIVMVSKQACCPMTLTLAALHWAPDASMLGGAAGAGHTGGSVSPA
jgi:WD40 repeat protein